MWSRLHPDSRALVGALMLVGYIPGLGLVGKGIEQVKETFNPSQAPVPWELRERISRLGAEKTTLRAVANNLDGIKAEDHREAANKVARELAGLKDATRSYSGEGKRIKHIELHWDDSVIPESHRDVIAAAKKRAEQDGKMKSYLTLAALWGQAMEARHQPKNAEEAESFIRSAEIALKLAQKNYKPSDEKSEFTLTATEAGLKAAKRALDGFNQGAVKENKVKI